MSECSLENTGKGRIEDAKGRRKDEEPRIKWTEHQADPDSKGIKERKQNLGIM